MRARQISQLKTSLQRHERRLTKEPNDVGLLSVLTHELMNLSELEQDKKVEYFTSALGYIHKAVLLDGNDPDPRHVVKRNEILLSMLQDNLLDEIVVAGINNIQQVLSDSIGILKLNLPKLDGFDRMITQSHISKVKTELEKLGIYIKNADDEAKVAEEKPAIRKQAGYSPELFPRAANSDKDIVKLRAKVIALQEELNKMKLENVGLIKENNSLKEEISDLRSQLENEPPPAYDVSKGIG